MGDSKLTISTNSKKKNFLDWKYNDYIKKHLNKTDEEVAERWFTYDSIIEDLIQLGFVNYFNEIKYRLTDGEDINDVMIDVINTSQEIKSSCWVYIRKLNTYKEEDQFRRFCD